MKVSWTTVLELDVRKLITVSAKVRHQYGLTTKCFACRQAILDDEGFVGICPGRGNVFFHKACVPQRVVDALLVDWPPSAKETP